MVQPQLDFDYMDDYQAVTFLGQVNGPLSARPCELDVWMGVAPEALFSFNSSVEHDLHLAALASGALPSELV